MRTESDFPPEVLEIMKDSVAGELFERKTVHETLLRIEDGESALDLAPILDTFPPNAYLHMRYRHVKVRIDRLETDDEFSARVDQAHQFALATIRAQHRIDDDYEGDREFLEMLLTREELRSSGQQ
jgi:hypothetical protein